ncbi:polysaccharide pyruvyl transferase family protein [Pseudoalteromonas arctica]|uniref:Polysaccharide pyruvyl transferase family protein n=1 Tax=Pseudoalteromonas arctica TaxID=394751 RepID=A0ABU9TH03_9GAMM
MKFKTIEIKLKELTKQIGTRKNDLRLNYCIENNAGDSFNEKFINDYFNKTVSKYTLGNQEHYLFCGSILSRANENSIVIGAGLISESVKFNGCKALIGCRGRLTLQRINVIKESLKPSFLGDPGLMVNEMLEKGVLKSQLNPDKIGIIPHFVDYDQVVKLLDGDDKYLIINIKRDYKDVCNDILKCHTILSSSLHGLIFADGLSVKNSWVKFSDKIVGGDFKFRDYYSVMDKGKLPPVECVSLEDLGKAASGAFVSVNPNYHQMLKTISEYFG